MKDQLGIIKGSPITADGDKQPVIIQKLDIRQIQRSNVDIQKWRDAIKAAESRIPRHTRLYNLYHELFLDAHLASVVEKRLLAVTNAEWEFVTKNGESVEEINDWIDTPHFELLLKESINAKIWGYTMLEFDFNAVGGPAVYLVPRKHMRQHQGAVSITETGDDLIDIREGAFKNLVVEVGDPDDLGLLASVAQYVIYKRGDFADWAQFAEIFGMPLVDATWDGHDPDQREQLVKSVDEMGGNGSIIHPEGTEIEFIQNNSGNPTGDLYAKLKDALNAEISKRVLGQTETTESSSGSGYAQSKTHAKVEDDINTADRKYVRRILNKRVYEIFEANGTNLRGGYFRIKDDSEERLDKKGRFDMAFRMRDNGIPVNDDEIYGLSGFEKPKDYEAQKAAYEAKKEQDAKTQSGKKIKNVHPDKNLIRLLRDFFKAPGSGASINMSLSEYYADCCPDHITLADGIALPGIDENMIRRIFKDELPEDQIDSDYYLRVANLLSDAVTEGMSQNSSDNYDRAMTQAALQHSVFSFSGFRAFDQQMQIREHLIDENGEPVSFATFRRRVIADGEIFNENHLRTEYTNALRTAQAADKWQYLQRFELLEYRTAGDERVRESHAELHGKIYPTKAKIWDLIYPPNGWNCRCTVIPADGKKADTDSNEMRRKMKKVLPAYFQKNAGKDLVIFNKNHPVVMRANDNGWAKVELEAVRHYGLPDSDVIYRDKNKLEAITPAKDRDEARNRFEPGEVTTADGLKVELGANFLKKIIEGKGAVKYADRYKFAHLAKEVLTNPDEIWSHRHGGDVQIGYIKFYRDFPLFFAIKPMNGIMEFKSFFSLDSHQNIEKKRTGVLKRYVKK